jgi:hypothetical protein
MLRTTNAAGRIRDESLMNLGGRDVGTVASNKFWSSMSFQNLVRLSKILKISMPDYAHVNKVSKN